MLFIEGKVDTERYIYIHCLASIQSLKKNGRFIISVEWANDFTTLLMVQSSSKPMHIKGGSRSN